MVDKLFKRSGIYSVGLIGSRVLGVLVFILFARILLPESFGDYVLFLTLLQILTFFADFGLVQWYQKKVRFYNRKKIFSQAIAARVVMLILSLLVSAVFLSATSTYSVYISLLFLMTLIPESFLSVADGYYFEKKQSLKVALKTTSKMIVLLMGFVLYQNSFSFYTAAILYMIGSFVTLLWFFPWHMLRGVPFVSLSRNIKTLRSSSRYALLIATSFAYSRGDALIIRYMLNSAALGLYGAAYRYLEALSLIPTALSHNLFPISAKKKGISSDSLIRITLVMAAVGAVLSLAIFSSSTWLIVGLLGEAYSPAIPLVKVFSAVLFMFFINAPLSTVVQSSNLLGSFLPYGIFNTILNIVLNILLIPIYGIVISAWIMLATEIVGFVINIAFTKKMYNQK